MKALNHFFAGSNTCFGFRGFFNELFNSENCKRLYILKGGPGVGKSSLMKRIASYAEDCGAPVEYFHCSSDPDALDGVVIDSKGDVTMLVDGSAPHVMDPVTPGAVDEIINLGIGLDRNMLVSVRDELQSLANRMKGCFAAAHSFALAAYGLRRAAASMTDSDGIASDIQLDKIMQGVDKTNATQKGRRRRLFLSAVTPSGMNLPQAVFHDMKVWFIKLPWYYDISKLLCAVADYALECGNAVDLCQDPVNAGVVEHIIISGNVIVTASQELLPYADRIFESTRLIPEQQGLPEYTEYRRMIDRAANALLQAKRIHDTIERFYIEAMDHAVNESAYNQITRLLSC